MDIFAKENIGHNIPCRIEKDGVQVVSRVRWTHAKVGEVVSHVIKIMKEPAKVRVRPVGSKTPNIYVAERSTGWTVVEVGV